MRNVLRKSLILVQMSSKWSAPRSYKPFKHKIMTSIILIFVNIMNLFDIFHLWKTFWLLFLLTFVVSAREKALWCPFLTCFVRTFSVKRWKRRSLWGKKWMGSCLFSAKISNSFFSYYEQSIFTTSTLTWRVNIYVSLWGKSIIKRNRSTNI